jgi:hypothetical protein
MLINFSNHASILWTCEQIKVATKQFGKIVDLPFPPVNPEGDEDYIQALAAEYLQKVQGIAGQARNDGSVVVHIMGEQTFTTAMVRLLQNYGFTCVASTTERVVREKDGVKTSEFRFVKFRKYL